MGITRKLSKAADGLNRSFLTLVPGVFHARGGKGGYVGAKRRRAWITNDFRKGYTTHKRRRRKASGRSTR